MFAFIGAPTDERSAHADKAKWSFKTKLVEHSSGVRSMHISIARAWLGYRYWHQEETIGVVEAGQLNREQDAENVAPDDSQQRDNQVGTNEGAKVGEVRSRCGNSRPSNTLLMPLVSARR